MITTSLQGLFECGSWIHDTKEFHFLMKHFGKDYLTIDEEPISFEYLLQLTDLEYTINCTSSRSDLHRVWRSFSVWCCQPFIAFITTPSCAEALKVAQQYIKKRASKDRLKAAYEKAYSSRFGDDVALLGLEDLTHTLCCNAANPDFEQSISNCFNGYALGMDRLGMTIQRAEELQRNEILRLVC